MNEFRETLDLASEEELYQIAQILFQRGLNPLDYLTLPPVFAVQSLDREALIAKIIDRFQFLAADGMTVLKGKTKALEYRDVLKRVFWHLKMRCSSSVPTPQLESELYLQLLERSLAKLPPQERQQLDADLVKTIKESDIPDRYGHLAQLLAKGTGVLALTTMVKPVVLHLLAKRVAWYFATYQVSQEALKAGGLALANRLQAYFTAALAKRGMAVAAARYGAMRGLFSMISPALWGLFLVDLGWRGIAANYSRIIPVIFVVAQIRLLKGA
ncbi:MAG: hypothetical protein LDL47_05195 [Cyanobacteria bacterium KgW148]|nr:hypothetical protein [Cyanobacteria bacterium KgW148]